MNRISTNKEAIANEQKMGSEIIIETIISQGIKTIFGYPGGCVIPLFDALINYPELSFYLVRHEQSATHAADGLARVTGKAQVVFATSGPGATNCITGIATAQMDSIPMIVITGQVKRQAIGTNAFQETNVIGVSRPITKYNYLVKNIEDLQETLLEAFFIANTARKGPVLIDIPVDIQRETYKLIPNKKVIAIRSYQTDFKADVSKTKEIWQMLSQAKAPLIYAGHGANNTEASNLLKTFITKSNIPAATTLLAQGTFPDDHDLALGMLGMHGTYTANIATTECDVCLVLGARFDDRVTGDPTTFLQQSKIIHVDLDPRSLNKVKKADISMLADCRSFLKEINKIATALNIEPWLKKLKHNKENFPPPNYYNYNKGPDKIRPEYILKQLSELTAGKAYIVTDVGQHQMFTCLHYKFTRAQSHITSGGLGTMGFSLPAAMGIATEISDYPIISISGDGGFQMSIQELATIRAYNLNVKIFIFNNSNLGMVKQWQDFFWKSRYASTVFDFNPSFDIIAKGYDIPSLVVRQRYEVPAAIKTALDNSGPFLIEFKIDPDSHVYPMVPSGQSITSILLGDPPPSAEDSEDKQKNNKDEND